MQNRIAGQAIKGKEGDAQNIAQVSFEAFRNSKSHFSRGFMSIDAKIRAQLSESLPRPITIKFWPSGIQESFYENKARLNFNALKYFFLA